MEKLQEKLRNLLENRRSALERSLYPEVTSIKKTQSLSFAKFERMKTSLIEAVTLAQHEFLQAETGDHLLMNYENGSPDFRIMIFPKGKPLQTWTNNEPPGIIVNFHDICDQIKIERRIWFGIFDSKEEYLDIKTMPEDYFIVEFEKILEEVFHFDITEREKNLLSLKARLAS